MKLTVDADWLRDHLASKKLSILDARSRRSYVESHIPRAVHADLFHYFVPGTDKKGLRQFHRDLARHLGKLGLGGKEAIVAYESKFGMRAARVAWLLGYAGAPRVLLLEGGFQAWRRSRFPVEKTPRKPRPGKFRVRPVSKVLATAGTILSPRPKIVLDVRSEAEYTGKENRDCDERRGRIPHAKWLEWTNFIHNGERFESNAKVEPILKKEGLTRDAEIITYCHRGARAAAAFYALRSLGYRNAKNYIGSWHEWSARKNLPVDKDDSHRLGGHVSVSPKAR